VTMRRCQLRRGRSGQKNGNFRALDTHTQKPAKLFGCNTLERNVTFPLHLQFFAVLNIYNLGIRYSFHELKSLLLLSQYRQNHLGETCRQVTAQQLVCKQEQQVGIG
jgi:hypothetical protein